jgi:K+/H+ antiporter YhaU regulatory subunit KhtT
VLVIADVRIEDDAVIVGRPLGELERDQQSRVLAIAGPGTTRFSWSPPPGRPLAAGDRLIVLATRAGLSTFLAQNRPPGRYDVTQDAVFFDQESYERERNLSAADGD